MKKKHVAVQVLFALRHQATLHLWGAGGSGGQKGIALTAFFALASSLGMDQTCNTFGENQRPPATLDHGTVESQLKLSSKMSTTPFTRLPSCFQLLQ